MSELHCRDSIHFEEEKQEEKEERRERRRRGEQGRGKSIQRRM